MKKLLSLAMVMLVLSAFSAKAQTWDFKKGLSDESIAALNADKNWTTGSKAEEFVRDGVQFSWCNADKWTEPLCNYCKWYRT